MQLEGVVTNVTAFGCFVDVGVHQDGLVHISQMANDFVADPMNRVKPGNIVSVRVISIDENRGRIGFSMKPESEKPAHSASKSAAKSARSDEKVSRPKGNRSAADKRPSKSRGNRQDKSGSNRSKAPET